MTCGNAIQFIGGKIMDNMNLEEPNDPQIANFFGAEL